ncbi:MAG TPA: aminomethyl-transferring glycine dehydrogenase subunit GcvPA [Candidatus Binatia bacterium]|nr:aminomethyl-transferring glycine dehydrogenase subunit GcvPA [Candidatus Binatia bacterium]
MSGYSPHTPTDVAAMLEAIGVGSIDDLVKHVPAHLRASAGIDLPAGLTEPELRARFAALAARNTGADGRAVFLGAGAYPHFSPGVVNQILLRSEFATAYTPYQPEVSQGTLQAIFEFQTFAALLLGLEVANASMYDGASATAEAVLMARRLLPDRRVVLLSRALHPHYREVVATYLRGLGDVEVHEVPFGDDGRIDLAALRNQLGTDTLCVVLGYPNVFGVIEDVPTAAAAIHDAGALCITATCEPLALALVRSPGSAGADIAVAEGQSLGLPVSYGGPGVGLFATHDRFLRSMPGRIVGETVDGDGRRGFVLTLATREQHIRRERATSNICTNQGLCALAVTVYLSMLGRHGLRRLARVNYQSAHATAARLDAAGLTLPFKAPFFNEFVVRSDASSRWEQLAMQEGIVAGFPLGRWYPELGDALLVCVTETHTASQIDQLVRTLQPAAVRSAGGR